jgi:hypothetical protein
MRRKMDSSSGLASEVDRGAIVRFPPNFSH